MLHSDGALELLGKDKEDRALEHFMFADLLLRKAEHTGISLFGGRWFVAVSRHLRNSSPLHIVERFLELGRNRYPKNASIWYESGTFQELLAGRPSLQRLPASSRDAESLSRLRVEVAVRDMVQRRDKHLDAAAGLLRASIAIDPSIAEARLHLGRVVMLQRSDRDALTTFNTLATDPGSPLVAYLASLFAGAVHERQGRLEQAADAYAAALTIWPGSQSGHIALSAVLQRVGRGDEARAALATLLSETREPPSEPLWRYFFEPEDEVRERLNELRVEARQ
jgi:tetratricopeptide (TPR) repeat protein